MNCPFCGASIDSQVVLRNCAHCGSPIFYGLHGYAKTPKEALIQSEAMRQYLSHAELAEQEQKKLFSSPQYKDDIIQKQIKGRLQTILEAIGLAALYSLIFTLITSPLIYLVVQPRLLRSYTVESLVAGSYLFYFFFGFLVFYLTSRSLPD
ncbi:zinc ribbon domain-containing protein [Polynucleobacter sp. AP-Nino-20-G2]|uniref:zinc ribbon domain-containing protein n=1 Tax=Polynucleobacter sp. AP-Nino-20-G2 TaxID=2576917 RepID=UPI001BFD6194|nr:zinc ribbon domain-containing protein [Polynucleobacter sp. AP-Nino-20-G2]QWE17258.1 zinc ribbon domain-containing protein [Polynucleobacter sp. AP-Nino-20-G2]